MLILGIPDNVDRKTIRPRSDWPLSARCQREHRRREEMRDVARAAFDALHDKELRVKVAVELAEAYGEDDPLSHLPNVATMTRNEMLDCLADGAVDWFIPEIELVYPGAIDPTA